MEPARGGRDDFPQFLKHLRVTPLPQWSPPVVQGACKIGD